MLLVSPFKNDIRATWLDLASRITRWWFAVAETVSSTRGRQRGDRDLPIRSNLSSLSSSFSITLHPWKFLATRCRWNSRSLTLQYCLQCFFKFLSSCVLKRSISLIVAIVCVSEYICTIDAKVHKRIFYSDSSIFPRVFRQCPTITMTSSFSCHKLYMSTSNLSIIAFTFNRKYLFLSHVRILRWKENCHKWHL